jgi:deoxyribonuclease V
MKIRNLHRWNISVKEAIKTQERLRRQLVLKTALSKIETIASCDVSFLKSDNSARACVIVFSFPELKILERVCIRKKIDFPYIPGLLTFREGPILLSAFKKVKIDPDLIIFDGQGICHPRRMGIAAHLGLILDRPTIGCAKSYLCGKFSSSECKFYKVIDIKRRSSPPTKLRQLKKTRGLFCLIRDERDNQVLGAAVYTKDNTRPVFVSVGNKISLNKAIEIVLSLSKYRIPEPIRIAHNLCKIDVKI